MAISARKRIKIPVVPSIVIAAVIAALIFWFAYLGQPEPPSPAMRPPTPIERSYAPNIVFSGLSMRAAENLVLQRVVEVRGEIANRGPRALTYVSVDCFFSGIQGKQIYHERQTAFASEKNPLKPGESRPFRLAFDHLPDTWNQTLPRLAVAHIRFTGKG